MIYNEKYNVYLNKDGVCLKPLKMKNGKLVLCGSKLKTGYIIVKCHLLHRVMWETFVGPIPDGYEIDHINHNRCDNRLCNLQLLSHRDNIIKSYTDGRKPVDNKGRVWSEFGRKFKEHFGITRLDDYKLYKHEQHIFYRDGKCSWE